MLHARYHRQPADALLVSAATRCGAMCSQRLRCSADKSEREAARFMTYVIIDACSAFSNFTTYFYDVFQNLQNGIGTCVRCKVFVWD